MTEFDESGQIPYAESPMRQLIENWSKENQSRILSALEEERQSLLASELTEGKRRSLQETDRWKSEMDICHAWKRGLTPPKGFAIIDGMVQESDAPDRYAIPHLYARSSDHHVICITPGQFVEKFKHIPPGGRIAILQQKAPQLVKTYSGGLAILGGPVKLISQQLNLTYRFHG